jgi:hypothetical protein
MKIHIRRVLVFSLRPRPLPFSRRGVQALLVARNTKLKSPKLKRPMNAKQFWLELHRNPDGSIDCDFYRTWVTALRRHAMRDAASLRAVGACFLTMIVGLAFVLLIAATPVQVPQDHAAATQANATSIR